ncbi:MAG: diguanylate cyclase [Fibrobacter sp.]|nr:diguanylate cyclase [Fibrobacter sp.]
MKDSAFVNFSRSIIVKTILILTIAMPLVVSTGVYIYTQKQTQLMLEWSFNNNAAQLSQITATATNEMKQFGDRLSLLAKTSEIQSMDPTIAASYLKSYNISTLFISGEGISIYDRQGQLLCDNSMVGIPKETQYPVDFSRITPHRPYITPWFRTNDDAAPERIFGINISNRATGDGSLVATFSLRRLWRNFADYKIGKNGFLVAVNSQGEILYHPDLKQWLTGTHKISELGLDKIDPRNFETKEPQFVKLTDKNRYLVNYMYDSNYDFGVFAFQSKGEIDELATSIKQSSIAILIAALLIILAIAAWMFLKLGLPLNRLTNHIRQISDGNIDIEQIQVGHSKDEIGTLSRAFNVMHSTIQRQMKELESHRNMLEQEVQDRTMELEEANKKLDLISRTDELTGLPNRRDMNKTVANEIGRCQRTQKPFCFIFIDIDHFKSINDTYGHACGDVVLKSVAQTIRSLLRKYDVFARYGGEEFLTLLPETDLDGAEVVAERFRRKISTMSVHYAGYTINVTVTLGVARFDPRLGADRSIQMADKALYQGKEGGRNQVVVWKPEWVTEADYEAAAIEMAEAKKISDTQAMRSIKGNGEKLEDEISISFQDEAK